MVYDYVEQFSDGFSRVRKENSDGYSRYGFIDRTGKIAVPLEYHFAEKFSDGLAKVGKRYDGKNEKYGFVGKDGTEILPCEYDDAGVLGAVAWVKLGPDYGIFKNPYYVANEIEIDKRNGGADLNSVQENRFPILSTATVCIAAAAMIIITKRGK